MPDSRDFELGEAEGAILLATAREAIASRLELRAPRWPALTPALSAKKSGAFVTIHSGHGQGGGRLRGCIGRMSASEALGQVIREMAIAAAFEDPRFPPLEKKEYPDISLEITVLAPMRQIAGVGEIEVGRHGVHLSKGWHSAVFLPQVATEQGWDREELLVNLCYKAGLSANAWKEREARLQVFEGRIFEE